MEKVNLERLAKVPVEEVQDNFQREFPNSSLHLDLPGTVWIAGL